MVWGWHQVRKLAQTMLIHPTWKLWNQGKQEVTGVHQPSWGLSHLYLFQLEGLRLFLFLLGCGNFCEIAVMIRSLEVIIPAMFKRDTAK